MTGLVPKYTIWEAIQAALSVATKALEEVRSLSRLPGPPGLDGIDFDEMEIVERDAGVFMQLSRGDAVKEWRLPVMRYRQVYQEGKDYDRGDTVTWGGSLWHCEGKTSAKPDAPDSGWRLAVKKGRDGKDIDKVAIEAIVKGILASQKKRGD